ncbi:MAG: acyl-CoA dehydrogenase family protein [Actinomycetota bacterium]
MNGAAAPATVAADHRAEQADDVLAETALVDGGLDERSQVVWDAVRAVVRDVIAPAARRVDAGSSFPSEGVEALARAGLGGLLVPAALGGTGDSRLAWVVAVEEVAAGCGSTSLVFANQMHAAHPIVAFGTAAQQSRHVPGLVDCSRYGSVAITEPDAGSDAASLRTAAGRVDGGYRLSGTKTFITSGDRADVVVVFATVDAGRGAAGVTAFLVERETPGFAVGRTLRKLGMHGSSTAELHFDDCFVPRSARLGQEGQGFRMLVETMATSRLSAAAQGVGLARAAWVRTAAHLAARLDPHHRAGQAEQFALAGARARIAAARCLLHRAAAAVDEAARRGDAAPLAEVALAKQHCTDLAVELIPELMALLGGDGDRVDLDVERHLRDARVLPIFDGTNQIQRMLVARDNHRRLTEGRPS